MKQSQATIETNPRDSWILLITCQAGIYIPKEFVEGFRESINNDDQVSLSDDLDICLDPDHEQYWDAWDNVLRCEVISKAGDVYSLHQDGDLWAVPANYDWDQDQDNF